MGTNRYTGQLRGPFLKNEELFLKIQQDATIQIDYIKQIGVQANTSTIVYINGQPYEIGTTGVYEMGNTKITSIYFKSGADNNTIIDYIIE